MYILLLLAVHNCIHLIWEWMNDFFLNLTIIEFYISSTECMFIKGLKKNSIYQYGSLVKIPPPCPSATKPFKGFIVKIKIFEMFTLPEFYRNETLLWLIIFVCNKQL